MGDTLREAGVLEEKSVRKGKGKRPAPRRSKKV